MSHKKTKKILFTGYAPVHFVCFRPLYEFFMKEPGYEIYVSGGLRTKVKSGAEKYSYNEYGLYAPFGVPRDRILFVDEMRDMDFDIVFSANTKLIAPRNAETRIQIFHGISFRNKAVRPDNMNCDFYFIVGPYMHRKFIEAGLLQEDDPRALRIGFPKTDRLLNGALKPKEQLHQYGLEGSRPVLLYAPTGQKNNSLETMGEEVIRRLSQTGKYDLLIKPHDHPKNASINWFHRLKDLENPHTRVVREQDVIALLFVADLLITDASSVSSEFSLLDRPMIFLNVPKLIDRASAAENSTVDLQTWGRKGGVLVNQPWEIADAVADSLAHPGRHSDIRRAMAEDLFYNPGKATQAAVQWLREGLLSAPLAAASY